jgi:hypothetical protein
MGQQLVNQRIENEAAIRLQHANTKIQKYQTRIRDLQQKGVLTAGIIQAIQGIISLQTAVFNINASHTQL